MGWTWDNSLNSPKGVAAQATAGLQAQPEHGDTANCWGHQLPAFTKTVNTRLRSLSSVLELRDVGFCEHTRSKLAAVKARTLPFRSAGEGGGKGRNVRVH